MEYNSTYDSIGRLISSTVTDMSTNKFKSAYEYKFDQNNNVKRFVTLTPYGSNATSYTYIKDNLPKYAYFTGGRKLTNSYDNLGRLIDTTIDTSTNIHTDYTYLDSNDSGYTTNFVETETNGDFSYKYEYDANGNITKLYRKDSNNNYVLSEEYTYNALGELTRVDYLDLNKRYKYSYDSGGNFSKEKVYTLSNGTETLQSTNNYDYEYLNWHDKLISYKGTTITYDNIGNPLSYRGMTFSWQNGRQLHTLTRYGQTATYSYDANGTRLKKNVNGVIHTYLYNGSQLLQETKGTKILDYSYDANGQIYAVRYRANANDEGTYYYYAHNTRGDIVGLYNADGTLHAKYTYDVWGNKLAVTNASGVAITSQTDIANIQPFRYRGYYYDYESGFYYLQSRYYDPVTHRFINADGLVSTGTGVLGYNMFSYCENNPVNMLDSKGCREISALSISSECVDERSMLCKKQAEALAETRRNMTLANYIYLISSSDIIAYDENNASITLNLFPIQVQKDLSDDYLNNELHILQQKILNNLYSQGLNKLSESAQSQLYGELLLHVYGYILWDNMPNVNAQDGLIESIYTMYKDELYSSVHQADITIINGLVSDKRPEINDWSIFLGKVSY